MFEENKNNIEQDLLFRSILDEGMEPAPAHVWDRIEEDLDRIARRRRAVLGFRRSAIGVAAAAALALGLFMDWGTDEDLVDPSGNKGMIAVVTPSEQIEDQIEDTINETSVAPKLLAMADKPARKEEVSETVAITEEIKENAPEQPESKNTKAEQSERRNAKTEEYDSSERFPDFWPEETKKRNTTSLVISGITGTNSAQNSFRVNPQRRPGISAVPQKTGIKETSTNTTYGIPVSAGAGVKIGFTPRWSIGVGLNYTLLTRKFYGTYTRIGDNGSIVKDISSDIRESQHYIGIPLNVYYDIVKNDQISLYAYAGGTAEKCIADKFQVLNTDITHTESVKGIQLSTNIGMGVEFLVGKHLGIYMDPSLRYYFNNYQPKSIRTAQPLMFGFEAGLRIRL